MANSIAAPNSLSSQAPKDNIHSPDARNQIANTAADSADDSLSLTSFYRVLRRRRKVAGFAASAVLAIAAAQTIHERLVNPTYQGSFQLLISDPINESGRGRGDAAGGVFAELARNTTSSDVPTLIELLRSPFMLKPLSSRFGMSPGALADRISISAGGKGGSDGILNVSLTGRDPQEDQRLLDALSITYLEAALNQRQQRLTDGIRFLDEQAPALEAKTSDLRAQLSSFRKRYNLLEPLSEAGNVRSQANGLEQSLDSLQSERARLLKARSGIVAGTLTAGGFVEALGTGPGSSGLSVTGTNQILLQQLTKVEEQLAEARSKFSNSSSTVRGLTARRNELLPLLRRNQIEAVDAALSLNANRLSTAKNQLGQMASRFKLQPDLIGEYEALQQKLQLAEENLAGFMKTRENFQLEIAQRTVPWKVISPPTMNPNPIKPSVPDSLAKGLVLALIAGTGAALLRDRLDHVFHSAGEVKDELDEILLGHIPHVPFFKGVREDNRFLLSELDDMSSGSKGLTGYQRFYYREALRNLYTSLRFLNSDRPLRSVALTSSTPAEGKSLANVLLSKTIAEMGNRVLLVDADLRKPQVHQRLGLNNLTGLSNLLTDENLNWRQAVQSIADYPGWSVITAGQLPPDPARLLSSAKMHNLVEELANCGDFDLIVYDTPPVLGLADSALVAEHLDGLILLVSLGQVDRDLPKESIARIRSSGAQLLGVVTNAIKKEVTSSNGASGYGAYDSSNTYAYYSDPEADDSAQKPQENGTTKSLLDRTRQQVQSLIHWIDS